VPPSRQPRRCLGRITVVLTDRSEAAACLRPRRCRRLHRLRPGKPLRRRVFAGHRTRSLPSSLTSPPLAPCMSPPSRATQCRRLHRELDRATFLAPVRPPVVPLFPRATSRALVRFPPRLLPLCHPSAPPSCQRSGAITRARAGAACTLRRRRPSWARLGCAHAAQAEAEPNQARPRRYCGRGSRVTVQLGRGRIRLSYS
jgi:hypothetical protein